MEMTPFRLEGGKWIRRPGLLLDAVPYPGHHHLEAPKVRESYKGLEEFHSGSSASGESTPPETEASHPMLQSPRYS